MISIRHAPNAKKNADLNETPAKEGETNSAWLKRVKNSKGGIILLGGSSLTHFRTRVAQSQLRSDLLPSFWSLVGILDDKNQSFVSVPLDLRGDTSDVPRTNGVQACQLKDYDDPELFPNIAVINFTNELGPINENVERIKAQRSVIDLPSLMLAWLAYAWGTTGSGNPLVAGQGLPCAAFVETVYGLAGIELTPGLSSATSCPEAIWQSAKWWRQFYKETIRTGDDDQARAIIPTGNYAIRQEAAAVVERNARPAKPKASPRRKA